MFALIGQNRIKRISEVPSRSTPFPCSVSVLLLLSPPFPSLRPLVVLPHCPFDLRLGLDSKETRVFGPLLTPVPDLKPPRIEKK